MTVLIEFGFVKDAPKPISRIVKAALAPHGEVAKVVDHSAVKARVRELVRQLPRQQVDDPNNSDMANAVNARS